MALTASWSSYGRRVKDFESKLALGADEEEGRAAEEEKDPAVISKASSLWRRGAGTRGGSGAGGCMHQIGYVLAALQW